MSFAIALTLLSVSPDTQPTTNIVEPTEIVIVTAPRMEKPEKADKTKKICRPDATTGSRVTSTICKTKAEWEALESPYENKKDHYGNFSLGGYY